MTAIAMIEAPASMRRVSICLRLPTPWCALRAGNYRGARHCSDCRVQEMRTEERASAHAPCAIIRDQHTSRHEDLLGGRGRGCRRSGSGGCESSRRTGAIHGVPLDGAHRDLVGRRLRRNSRPGRAWAVHGMPRSRWRQTTVLASGTRIVFRHSDRSDSSLIERCTSRRPQSRRSSSASVSPRMFRSSVECDRGGICRSSAAVVVAYISGYALVALWSGDEAALGIALALCIACISRNGGQRVARWRWIALGLMAGLFTLEKLSLGVAIVALCAIGWPTCAPGTRWRTFALTAIPVSAVFVVGWFGTGNGFTNLIAYVRTSEQVSSGYSAMASTRRPTIIMTC